MTDPNSKVYEFKVEMTCDGCSSAVEKVLSRLQGKGVHNVQIDLPGQQVLVTSSLSPDELLTTIKKTGKATEYIGIKSS